MDVSTFLLSFSSILVLNGLDDAYCIGEGDLRYSSTRSDANLFQKRSHRHIQTYVLPAVWASLSPVKLTHENNGHTRDGMK